MTANQDTSAEQEQPVADPLPHTGDRPTRCRLCGQNMFYVGDPRYEPEVRIEAHQGRRCVSELYAHAACWMELMESSSCAKNPEVRWPCPQCSGTGTIEIQVGEEDDPCANLCTCDECGGTGESTF